MSLSFPNQVLCGQWQNLTTPELTFSNNAWGQDSSGGSCLNVTNNATDFADTWKWTNVSDENLVHAYPNVNLNSVNQAPVNISSLAAINVNVWWDMFPSVSYSPFEASALAGVDAIANVAYDMFFDPDPSKATSTSSPSYEVMVWLGYIGAVYPIGFFNTTTAVRPTCTMGNTTFTLYEGPNDSGQQVFTWVASENTTSFSGDLSVGIRYLLQNKLLPENNFLGVIQFGSETLHALEYVTFTASGLSINVTTSAPKTSDGASVRRGSILVVLAGLMAVAMLLL